MKTLLALAVSLTLLAGIAAPKAKAPTPQEKFDEAVLRAYEETKDDTAAFRARLEALRPLADAEGPSGEAKLDADRRFFDRLCQSSRRLLNTLRDRRAKAPTDTIVALTMEMLQPEERVDYEVRYDGDLPQSAEGAARSDVFERLPKENRLGGSGVYRPSVADAAAAHGHPRQLKRLRSAPPFRLAADEPGYERNFAAACDGRGLHLYLRCRDPEAWKTAEGLKDEFGFDISVQPGELEAERFFSGTFADPAAFRGIEWDAPHPGYRLAMDALKVDAFARKVALNDDGRTNRRARERLVGDRQDGHVRDYRPRDERPAAVISAEFLRNRIVEADGVVRAANARHEVQARHAVRDVRKGVDAALELRRVVGSTRREEEIGVRGRGERIDDGRAG